MTDMPRQLIADLTRELSDLLKYHRACMRPDHHAEALAIVERGNAYLATVEEREIK